MANCNPAISGTGALSFLDTLVFVAYLPLTLVTEKIVVLPIITGRPIKL